MMFTFQKLAEDCMTATLVNSAAYLLTNGFHQITLVNSTVFEISSQRPCSIYFSSSYIEHITNLVSNYASFTNSKIGTIENLKVEIGFEILNSTIKSIRTSGVEANYVNTSIQNTLFDYIYTNGIVMSHATGHFENVTITHMEKLGMEFIDSSVELKDVAFIDSKIPIIISYNELKLINTTVNGTPINEANSHFIVEEKSTPRSDLMMRNIAPKTGYCTAVNDRLICSFNGDNQINEVRKYLIFF